ncbi:serine/threonine protein kinase [Caldibacillus lycopersici]|uniref:Serine/threonine protein kinase n=1 Tax=Perspicuibacillus lycopersici TaxID=1325689 RepID=A0AAE3IRF6_9BACI|nr:serine/threonine protein kinase [Perspicuibacillus lycopersici]MCU9613072.1 serine/threonine protein kinase [Perspicuibacillus lycopersici]
MNMASFSKLIENQLMKSITLQSRNPHDPIEVDDIPKGWECIGVGNYAAVFVHESAPDLVVKVIARDRAGLEKEAQVYKQLGDHPAYSKLLHQGADYLVLQRLAGITLYEAVAKGIRIPETVIKDVNQALAYARKRGLNPYDVHGKNVMMKNGKGYVVDVSDFYKEGKDEKWNDLVKAYYLFYKKTLYKYPIKVPLKILDFVRHSYRLYKRLRRRL